MEKSQMEPSSSDEPEYQFSDALLDDEYSHVFIEYDQDSISLSQMIETIETTGTRIVETVIIRDVPKPKNAVLFRVEGGDIRDIILGLARYPLIKIKGYDTRTKTTKTRSGP